MRVQRMRVVDHRALMPFQLTICGIDEVACHCTGGVTHVLSILDPDWPAPEPLSSFELDRRLRLRFHDVIESCGCDGAGPPDPLAPEQPRRRRRRGRGPFPRDGGSLMPGC